MQCEMDVKKIWCASIQHELLLLEFNKYGGLFVKRFFFSSSLCSSPFEQ